MNESSKIAKMHLSPLRILLILMVLLAGIYFAQRSGTDPEAYKNDFNVYYFAAQEVLAGRTPYDNALGDWTPYLYPPLLAELLSPFGLLPLPLAAYLWFLINAFALFAALRMCAGLLKDSHNEAGIDEGARKKITRQQVTAMVTAAVFLRFILDNFDYGQVNLLVAALSVGHVYFYSKNRKIAAVLMLVFAVSIKITPLVFLLYHLVKGRWKFVAAGSALTLALTVLSFAPFGSRAPAAFHTFVNRTVKNEQGFNLAFSGNQSLRAAIERLKGKGEATDPASPMTTIIGIGCLALACFAAYKAKSDMAAAAPFFCCAVLLSPLSWKQHFVILILPVAFLLGEALRCQAPRTRNVLLMAVVLVFALFNLTSPRLVGLRAGEWCDAHSLVFAGAFGLFVVLIGYLLLSDQSGKELTLPT